MFDHSDEVTEEKAYTVNEVAISNFNNQGYWLTAVFFYKILVFLCKRASKNSCVTFSSSIISSTICVSIRHFQHFGRQSQQVAISGGQ